MTIRASAAAAAVLWCLSHTGLSAQAETQTALDCENALTTLDMNQCALRVFEAADRELNAVYRDAIATLTDWTRDLGTLPPSQDDPVASLRAAQRQWITYRDRNCEWHAALAMGGTIRTLYHIGCKTRMTEERTQELREHVTEQN